MTPWTKALFAPRRVAVVGASVTPGKLGHLVMQNLMAQDRFDGDIVAIRPERTEVFGRPAYPSLSAVPGGADLAIIVAPAEQVPGIIMDCAAAKVSVAVVISSGFAETGAEGAVLERQLIAAARSGGVRLIGPNCFGVISTPSSLNASLGMGMPARGGIGLITQSGAYGMAAASISQEDLAGFSRVVACGNKADLDETDLLYALADDPETQVIAMLLESIDHGRRFFEAAQRIAQHKPIIVLKAGRGEAGRSAAGSHTAALATDTAVTLSALRQAGVYVVEDGRTMLDLAAALDRMSPLAGRRVGIITNSGGTGVELADLLEAKGLSVPRLSGSLQSTIRQALPAYASAENPIDVTTAWRQFPRMYGGSLEALLASDEVDAVVVVLLQRAAMMGSVIDRVIAEVGVAHDRGCTKPVHVCWVAPEEAKENRQRLLAAGIPCHPWPARTADVLALCARNAPALPAVSRQSTAEEISRSDGWLPSDIAFELAANAGVPIAPWRLAASRDEAIATAEELGMPVVLKAERPGLLHKSDSGGVFMDLTTAETVGRAYDEIADSFGCASALVQQQVPPGIELLLGARRDPNFDMVIMVGLGGIWVEALNDVALRLAPLDEAEASAMLNELRGRTILDGGRGRQPVDVAALAEIIANLSHWIADAPWLEELDLNPIIANAGGLAAVDVRMRASGALSAFGATPSKFRIRKELLS